MNNTTYNGNLNNLKSCKTNNNNSSIPIWYRCANISPKATEVLSRKKKPLRFITSNIYDTIPDNLAI